MKKVIIPAFILLINIFLIGCTQTKKDTIAHSQNTYRQISMSEAQDIMNKEKDYIILDVRTQDEYKEGHISNAIYIPNETIGDKEIDKLPNKNQLIMVYCRSGNRSKQASEKLVKLGYTNIVEIGGIKDWQGKIEKS